MKSEALYSWDRYEQQEIFAWCISRDLIIIYLVSAQQKQVAETMLFNVGLVS